MAERHQINVNDEPSSSTPGGGTHVQPNNVSELPTTTTQPSGEAAIELQTLPRTPSRESLASISSDDVRLEPRAISVRSVSQASSEATGPFRGLKKFWSTHVVLTVSQHQTLDHGALERTFLAYMRTSLAFSFFGVLVAQAFTLPNKLHPDVKANVRFHKIGISLSCVCHGCALLISIMGAHRFWRQQCALTKGKVYSGGWEVSMVVLLTGLISGLAFVLVIVSGALGSNN